MAWLERLQEAGAKIPLLERDGQPLLHDHLYPVWEAFVFLTHYRTIGMAEGPIPLTEVLAYFGLMSIAGEEYRQWFAECLRGLDQAYLKERHATG